MTRDPDYLWLSIQTAASGIGVVLALAVWRVAVALVEWWAR